MATVKRGDDGLEARMDAGVVAFMDGLEHPMKAEIDAVRRIILGASPQIAEGIKWNAPSFRTTEYFATFHLRAKTGVQVVFHTGAKVKASASKGVRVEDPAGMLDWRAKDRALVTFADAAEVRAKGAAFKALVRAWIGVL